MLGGCGHVFCAECLESYLRADLNETHCPVCRQPTMKKKLYDLSFSSSLRRLNEDNDDDDGKEECDYLPTSQIRQAALQMQQQTLNALDESLRLLEERGVASRVHKALQIIQQYGNQNLSGNSRGSDGEGAGAPVSTTPMLPADVTATPRSKFLLFSEIPGVLESACEHLESKGIVCRVITVSEVL